MRSQTKSWMRSQTGHRRGHGRVVAVASYQRGLPARCCVLGPGPQCGGGRFLVLLTQSAARIIQAEGELSETPCEPPALNFQLLSFRMKKPNGSWTFCCRRSEPENDGGTVRTLVFRRLFFCINHVFNSLCECSRTLWRENDHPEEQQATTFCIILYLELESITIIIVTEIENCFLSFCPKRSLMLIMKVNLKSVVMANMLAFGCGESDQTNLSAAEAARSDCSESRPEV